MKRHARLIVLLGALVLLGACGYGYAAESPQVKPSISIGPVPSYASPSVTIPTYSETRPTTKAPVKPTPNKVPVKPTQKPTPKELTLYPTLNATTSDTATAQKMVDTGALVTWTTDPTCILAGHDNRGWAFLNSVPTGTIVYVKSGPCAGKYQVYDHKWQSAKGGPYPSWLSGVNLVLQSCTGSTGMGFSLARRLT